MHKSKNDLMNQMNLSKYNANTDLCNRNQSNISSPFGITKPKRSENHQASSKPLSSMINKKIKTLNLSPK